MDTYRLVRYLEVNFGRFAAEQVFPERSLPGMQIKTAIRKRRFDNARSDGMRRRELWKPDARKLDGKREVICLGDISLKKRLRFRKNTASA